MQVFRKVFVQAPVAWQRARRKGGKYFDCQLAEKNSFRYSARDELPETLLKGPLAHYFLFAIPMPASWSNKRKKERLGTLAYDCPKDKDNLTKFMMDAFQGYVYADDKQLAIGMDIKIWSDIGFVYMYVSELE